MARFFGVVGYTEGATEIRPGVWDERIIERPYYGDVKRDSRALQPNEYSVTDNLTVGNLIEIVADAYANENFHAIRYVNWAGAKWVVSNVDVQSPRLVLRLGGVYNGPSPGTTTTP